MKVSEVKALVPLSDVFDLVTGAKYLMVTDDDRLTPDRCAEVTEWLASFGYDVVVLPLHKVRIYDVTSHK